MKKQDLLIIDCQNDFVLKDGALSVSGAYEDAQRLAKFINEYGHNISDIYCTLDSHHFLDIAHPAWWIDANGNHPKIYTIISEDDIKNGKWRTSNPAAQKRSAEYVSKLAQNKRYPLCVWPPHCLIGTSGHNVEKNVSDALLNWSKTKKRNVLFVTKGSNPWTEHYSAIKADVPDPTDPTTMLNTRFINILKNADVIFISGQALSHCVRSTILDVCDKFDDESVKKFHLLRDTCSNVPGFEHLGEEFVQILKKKGGTVSNVSSLI